LYLDGELPSPWKEKMEAHLETCSGCRARLETYRGFCMDVLGSDAIEAAKDRVWSKLAAPAPVSPQRKRLFSAGKKEGSLWRRSLTLPLPAAAAVFIIIALFAILSLRPRPDSRIPDTAAASGLDLDVFGIVPASDMNRVLQYLSNQDTSDFVIIRLPESRSFSSFGEPTLLKAADYTGSLSPGRAPSR
jgi:hypothetical protein